jgi:acyl carrier protein
LHTRNDNQVSTKEEFRAMVVSKKEEIWQLLVGSVESLLADEGRVGPAMTPETRINGDLEISSLSMVHLLLALEDKMGQGFEFEKIALRDGQYRSDLTLGELWEFIVESDAQTGMFNAARSN